MKQMPRYPVFIPSKGRSEQRMTPAMFDRAGVPFKLVVEPQDRDAYASVWGIDRVLTLPDNDRGLVYSRNWIKDYATEQGYERHWQFDDDVKRMIRIHKGRRIEAPANIALAAAEDFVERYENVALASFNSWFFIPAMRGFSNPFPPFYLNTRCYTVFLIWNAIPNRFRGRYNEDTDMSLQVLSAGYCTILFNAFTIDTPMTMTHTGGQTDIYVGDGRLRMARELETRWPGVVTTRRRFKRPQHVVRDHWTKFDTPLIKKQGVEIPEGPNNYGLQLKAVAPVENDHLKALLAEEQNRKS